MRKIVLYPSIVFCLAMAPVSVGDFLLHRWGRTALDVLFLLVFGATAALEAIDAAIGAGEDEPEPQEQLERIVPAYFPCEVAPAMWRLDCQRRVDNAPHAADCPTGKRLGQCEPVASL
jgi:hypothetical protein